MVNSDDKHDRIAAAISFFRLCTCRPAKGIVQRMLQDECQEVKKITAMGFWATWYHENAQLFFREGNRTLVDRSRLEVIHILKNDPDWRIRIELCMNPILMNYIREYAELANDGSYEVRLSFASQIAMLEHQDPRYNSVMSAALANRHHDDFMPDLLAKSLS